MNGVQVVDAPRTGPIGTSASPLWIGGNSPYGEYFSGRIDEVRVYRDGAQPGGDPDRHGQSRHTGPNAPKLVITAPAEGSTSTGGTVNITYTTTGDLTGVDHVHFQVDNDPVKMDLSLDGTYASPASTWAPTR